MAAASRKGRDMTSEPATPRVVLPAATVIVFRNAPGGDPPEVLMVQRAREMRFAGGMAVFPGGRIDPADRELAARIAPRTDPEIGAAQVAGIRETLEETGLAIGLHGAVTPDEAARARAMLHERGELAPVLERFGWSLDLSQLSLFAHWCPDFERSFDTRFFVTDLGTGNVDITVDATENTRLFWASARDFIKRRDEGKIAMIFPTLCNLHRVAQFGDFAGVLEQSRRIEPRVITPARVMRGDELWLTIPEDRGYPVTGTPFDKALRG